MRRRRRPTDEDILEAIADLVDDGFCERRELLAGFRGFGERELLASLARAARRNLILERRGPDGRSYVALTSEGWNVYRTNREPSG